MGFKVNKYLLMFQKELRVSVSEEYAMLQCF